MKRDGVKIWKSMWEVVFGRTAWFEFEYTVKKNFWIAQKEKSSKSNIRKILLILYTACKDFFLEESSLGSWKKSPRD